MSSERRAGTWTWVGEQVVYLRGVLLLVPAGSLLIGGVALWTSEPLPVVLPIGWLLIAGLVAGIFHLLAAQEEQNPWVGSLPLSKRQVGRARVLLVVLYAVLAWGSTLICWIAAGALRGGLPPDDPLRLSGAGLGLLCCLLMHLWFDEAARRASFGGEWLPGFFLGFVFGVAGFLSYLLAEDSPPTNAFLVGTVIVSLVLSVFAPELYVRRTDFLAKRCYGTAKTKA